MMFVRSSAPGDYGEALQRGLLAQVPESQLTAIFSDYFAKAGSLHRRQVDRKGRPNSGRFELSFEHGDTVSANLTIEADAPHLVAGLFSTAHAGGRFGSRMSLRA